jgi:hypothetical protein
MLLMMANITILSITSEPFTMPVVAWMFSQGPGIYGCGTLKKFVSVNLAFFEPSRPRAMQMVNGLENGDHVKANNQHCVPCFNFSEAATREASSGEPSCRGGPVVLLVVSKSRRRPSVYNRKLSSWSKNSISWPNK